MPTTPDNNRLEKLAQKYLKGELDPSEQQEFDNWFASDHDHDVFTETGRTAESHRKELLFRIHQEAGIDRSTVKARTLWLKITVAASVLLSLSLSAYWLLTPKPTEPEPVRFAQDISPGGNKAVLTLSNGEKVVLTGAKNGLLARQGGVAIAKRSDGQLSYSNNLPGNGNGAELFNTIETPRGGKYKLIMADGTVAILDAASSIRYPVAFNGAERKVEITGQVYFEVVHNKRQPFKVSVKGQIVEDLGTIFNINAYDDEPVIKTTLIEGSIGLTKLARTTILKPGEQAINADGDLPIKIIAADIDEATAWKNDNFLFNHEELESVMRKISRWYDVDIKYRKGPKIKESYLGGLTRYSNVSEVLKMLEITGDVRFEIKGKTIEVFSKEPAQ